MLERERPWIYRRHALQAARSTLAHARSLCHAILLKSKRCARGATRSRRGTCAQLETCRLSSEAGIAAECYRRRRNPVQEWPTGWAGRGRRNRLPARSQTILLLRFRSGVPLPRPDALRPTSVPLAAGRRGEPARERNPSERNQNAMNRCLDLAAPARTSPRALKRLPPRCVHSD